MKHWDFPNRDLQTAGLQDDQRFLAVTFRKALPPAVLSMGGVMASTLANSLIAGNLIGGHSLAVLSIVSPIYSAFSAIGALSGAGVSSVAAWCVGRDDSDGCSFAVTLAALLSLGLSLVLAVTGVLFLGPLAAALGAKGELLEPVQQYIAIYLFSGVGIAGIYPPYFLLKLEGRHQQSTALFLCLAAASVGLEWFCVSGLQMGLNGVALGCVIANVGTALIGWRLLLRGSFRLSRLSKIWGHAPRVLAAGSPAALNNLCGVLAAVALNRMLADQAGEAGLSAFGVASMASNLSLILINGLSQAASPFVGVFTGERDHASLRQIARQALQTGLCMILPVSLLLAGLSRPFCAVFGAADNPLAPSAVAFYTLSLPFAMLSTLFMNYYLSSGRTWLANLLTACRSYLFLAGSARMLSMILGVSGVWLSFAAAELLSWLILSLTLLLFHRIHPELSGLLLLDRRYEESGRSVAFSVHSRVEDILDASQRISAFCAEHDLTPKRTMLISLSLEEMLVSIKDHSFPEDEDQDISIRIFILPEQKPQEQETIILRIRCSGVPFNPIDYYNRRRESASGTDKFDLLESLDDSLGIAMIASAAQAVDYKTTFGVNNLTIII